MFSKHKFKLSTLFIALSLFALQACKSTQKNKNSAASEKWISMSKGACFGTCPIYTMTVMSDGKVEYEGKKFTDKLGIYTRQMNQFELDSLADLLKKANFAKYPEKMDSRIPDLAEVTLVRYEKGTEKSVSFKENKPEILANIQEQLDRIAAADNWTLTKAPDFGLPENVIPNEVIVQLADGVEVEEWKGKYMRGWLKMEVKKQLATNKNYWLMTYDMSAMSPKDLLETMKNDDEVINAELNKKVSDR